MSVHGEITKDTKKEVSSSSSAITMPSTHDGNGSSRMDFDESFAPLTPKEQLAAVWGMVLSAWGMVVAAWKNFTTWLYYSTVNFIGELLADILSQPRLHDVAVGLVVTAINAFMDQEDIGSKVDKTARNVIYDVEKARETSHALGKEVVPMVAGFVGGMAASLKPSEFKKRRVRRKQHSDRVASEKFENLQDFDEDDEDDYEEEEYPTISKKAN